MDLVKRDALVSRVGQHVSPKNFFDGNKDGASIWCNFDASPEPPEVYKVLRNIKNRPEVHDVTILVTQFDGGEDDWPFSDTILFVSSCEPEAIQSWLDDRYAPDKYSIDPCWTEEALSAPSETHVINAWWD